MQQRQIRLNRRETDRVCLAMHHWLRVISTTATCGNLQLFHETFQRLDAGLVHSNYIRQLDKRQEFVVCHYLHPIGGVTPPIDVNTHVNCAPPIGVCVVF